MPYIPNPDSGTQIWVAARKDMDDAKRKPSAYVAKEGFLCAFCGKPFVPPDDYPRDFKGDFKGAIVIFGNVVRYEYGYSERSDEVAVCGPMCPECRETVMGFLKRKGLGEERQ